MNNDKFIEIRLTGSEIRPGSVRSSDIAEIIKSVEEMISAVVIRDTPGLKKENVIIGLTNIQPGSIGLQFLPNLPDQAFSAASLITQSLNERDFSSIPNVSLKGLYALASFTKKHHCHAEILTQNGTKKLLAVITPDTEIFYLSPIVGQTTMYGTVMRVGGIEPRIMLRTINNQTVYCDTNFLLAKQLAEHLYAQVCVTGTAKWTPDTLELEEFQIEEIIDYQETSAVEAFQELSQLLSSQFENIADVESFVTAVRRGEWEE
ncbi:hypothetical protein U14_01925 [Candidatus Moduliflexus flocculans]|uniref:Uncharacterized protein n=1 Tax=Candidatus Moduliflexus flocculans TaxID=1499966 RepID=A0A0S6VWR1_9BACT|nr:hypothetical protein U14_01925 [Candidatus Moduliflexus flocculans]